MVLDDGQSSRFWRSGGSIEKDEKRKMTWVRLFLYTSKKS